MDVLSQFIADEKVPIGRIGKSMFDFLTLHFEPVFDAIGDSLNAALDGTSALLLMVPPVLFALCLAALALWLQRSWRLAVAVVVGLLFIINQGMWDETIDTLVQVVAATVVTMAIGIPIGIAAAHNDRLWRIIRPILDLMQTLPTFVYLIPVLILFGLGAAPGLIVTVIFAAAVPIRLTHLGISTVPVAMLEAGSAFGATRSQLLWKVELPAALRSIMEGLTQCIMLCLSMVVITALIGAEGLGKPIVRALNTVNIPLGVEAGLSIVIVAIILDRISRVPSRMAR